MQGSHLIKPQLIEVLAWKCGCEYLSELHDVGIVSLCWILSQFSEEDYSESEWRDAFYYLTGEEPADTDKVYPKSIMRKLEEKKKEVRK